ncbi:centrosomal AT-AC splicing factor [Rana temporaria]|uniref:centrosomal AT-AC splicing factor n=1 Tax=Rana temporaria TaxID=8407 RepID=UPI001AACEA5C|nr:centrosomal AT-AC splicing factor [Rana temporaria]
MAVYECTVCRKTVFYGRRKHVYEKGHRERLQALLRAFSDKVEAARRMIAVAVVEKFNPLEHEEKYWCHCCEEEVGRHISDGSVTVLYGGMLEHMCSPEHKKAVNKFWWTHQADGKLKERFFLSMEEFERFKSSVSKALEGYEETEDVLIKQMADQIQRVEESRREILQNALEPIQHDDGAEDESWGNSVYLQCSATASSSGSVSSVLENPSVMPSTSFTYIGKQVAHNKGNIYTDAVPPWMICDEEDTIKQQEIGPALEGFLKHKEKMALKKLPPKRVGANFDHNTPTDEGWLPSFGRVWNSGRRWQSRHQYRHESSNTGTKRKRNEDM